MLFAGVKFQIMYKYFPENADLSGLKWTSSNIDVATVDDRGEVTCIAPGNVYIRLSAPNGVYDEVLYSVGTVVMPK